MLTRLPSNELDLILDYLCVKDLVNLSQTCSYLNTHIYSYLQTICRTWKLDLIPDVYSPMIKIMEENVKSLHGREISLIAGMKRCQRTLHDMERDCNAVSKADLYHILLHQQSLQRNLDPYLSGKWDATYNEGGTKYAWHLVLQFNKNTKTVRGYSKDVYRENAPARDFALITGSYNLPTVKIGKRFLGEDRHLVNSEGKLEDLDDRYVINGLYFGMYKFQMVKMKKKYDSESKF